MKLPDIKFNPQDAYKLACIVSNDFIGCEKTISYARVWKSHFYINSGKCDYAPFIRVYCHAIDVGIDKIEVLGDYTDGWQEIHQFTYDRIKKELHAETT